MRQNHFRLCDDPTTSAYNSVEILRGRQGPWRCERLSPYLSNHPLHSSFPIIERLAAMSTGTPGTDAAAAAETSKDDTSRRRQPSLLDSLLVDPDQDATDAGFGILCNDPSGLCLSATGSFVERNAKKLTNMDDAVTSGVYTSLTKLAQQLPPAASNAPPPLITVETDDFNLLLKEYDGHAIALKVPVARASSSSPGGASSAESPSANGTSTNGTS